MKSFSREFWKICGPYWRSDERWRSGAILAAVIILNLSTVYISVLFNQWYAVFYNALQTKDFAAFSYQLLWFCVYATIFIVVAVYQTYLQQMLQIRWRNWLTHRYTSRWLENGTFYRLQLANGRTDNPDQRIAEDVNGFVEQTLSLSLGVLQSVVSLASFAVILWNLSGAVTVAGVVIHGYMLWAALLYAIVGSWLVHRIGAPLISLNYQQQQYEANLRFSLVRIRQNAESISFYHGEEIELAGIDSFLKQVVANWWAIMRRQKFLSFFSSGYSQIAIVFPFLVAAPRYFSGAIDLGGLIQITQAFGQVQSALSWFVTAYPSLAGWRATIDRLSGFETALSETPPANGRQVSRSEAHDASGISVAGLNVYLPDGSPLLEEVTFDLAAGSRILVSGPSGSGKSTLLRTLSGIWPYCEGHISPPKGTRALFCPQKPYLPLGTFRDIVSYPAASGTYSDEAIRSALWKCGLGGFAGRLDENTNWTLQLSLGEQQRVAFTRALLLHPDWLFLDEATSALDEEAEADLYTLIMKELEGCTVISVAHRKTLGRFHEGAISLTKRRNGAAAGSKIIRAGPAAAE